MSVSHKGLRPEILYMVVRVLVAEFERLSNPIWLRELRADRYRVLSTLLSLRLTCQSFGRANIIKAALFKEVTLQATRLAFHRLSPSVLFSIAPFVRKINFLSTSFAPGLDIQCFTRLLEILLQHESDLPVRCRRHVERQWGTIPTTEAEVAAAFEKHVQQARVDEDIRHSGELQVLWTAALRTFQHATEFELHSIFGRHPLDPSEDSGTIHCSSCNESRCTLYECTGAGEGQMFSTAIQCLESSRKEIKTMSVHRGLAQHFSIMLTASWNLLDLSKLKTLKFPDLEIVEDEQEDDFAERDAAVELCLTQFLRKPLPNLRELSIDHYLAFPRLTLPSLAPIFLPRLGSLTLGGILLRIPHLTEIVTSCAALREISLRDCHPQGPEGHRMSDPTDEAWQLLFDALYHHPTLRHITIADEWDATNNQGEVGAPSMPDTVGLETYRVMLQTGMSAVPGPEFVGLWDEALQIYLLTLE